MCIGFNCVCYSVQIERAFKEQRDEEEAARRRHAERQELERLQQVKRREMERITEERRRETELQDQQQLQTMQVKYRVFMFPLYWAYSDSFP